jgi:protein-S-isoprenylcysteine O-methyltransferase Ste14
MATRMKLRSGTTRFVGAIVGLILYLLVILALNPGSRDPTNNAGMVWLIVGAVISMFVASWFLPWIRRRFSAHYARRKAKLKR